MLCKHLKTICLILTAACALGTVSCTKKPAEKVLTANSREYNRIQKQYFSLLKQKNQDPKTVYGIVKMIASNMQFVKDYNSLILFLTEWVDSHPDDMYNAYWLLMIANAYTETNADPIAEYYCERIIKNYPDLEISNPANPENKQSVHFLCLQHLINISNNPANKISYFNQLIDRFAKNVSLTELYMRLGKEYEKEGQWDMALKSYQKFVNQDDASRIQIAGIPDAYKYAKRLIDFNNSPKNWTFDSLDSLVTAVKKAIATSNPNQLERYKSKVNFFAMSWRQDETDTNSMESLPISGYMSGKRILYSADLDSSSTPTEAYLRTTGWQLWLPTWYLYFRKVNFPVDPEIHGRWEWAGIYFGEKI